MRESGGPREEDSEQRRGMRWSDPTGRIGRATERYRGCEHPWREWEGWSKIGRSDGSKLGERERIDRAGLRWFMLHNTHKLGSESLTSRPFIAESFDSLRSGLYSPLPLREAISIRPIPSRRALIASSLDVDVLPPCPALEGDVVILAMKGLLLPTSARTLDGDYHSHVDSHSRGRHCTLTRHRRCWTR